MTIEKVYTSNMLDARSVILQPNVPCKKCFDELNNIEKLELGTDNFVKLGDKIPVNIKLSSRNYDTYYVNNHMSKYKDNIKISEFQENDSSTYILPLINLDKKVLLINRNLINCYLKHYNYNHHLGDYVYLMFRYVPARYYSNFVKALPKVDQCVSHQKDKDKRFDCFIFKTEDKFVKDINLIMEGRVSKISNPAKKLILDFHDQQNPSSYLYQILFRGNIRRKELEDSLGMTLPKGIDLIDKPNIVNESWI